MKKAAPLFTGAHNFKTYTVRHQKKADYWRTIQECSIKVNTVLSANFFPERSYMLVVRGKGFMRYQIRMIMGALIQLGRGELNSVDIEDSLSGKSEITLTYVAPGSGLILHRVLFE
jgi:tRNA pseudouridine38-40 synthase